MAYTIELTTAQEKGLDLYTQNVYPNRTQPEFVEKNDQAKKQEAFEFLVTSSVESVLRSEFERQNRTKTLDEMANVL